MTPKELICHKTIQPTNQTRKLVKLIKPKVVEIEE